MLAGGLGLVLLAARRRTHGACEKIVRARRIAASADREDSTLVRRDECNAAMAFLSHAHRDARAPQPGARTPAPTPA